METESIFIEGNPLLLPIAKEKATPAIVYGVVDRANYGEHRLLDIVEIAEGSDADRRFHCGASCSGWSPLKRCITRKEAEEYLESLETEARVLMESLRSWYCEGDEHGDDGYENHFASCGQLNHGRLTD